MAEHYDDLARIFAPEDAALQLSMVVNALMHELGGEVTLPPDWWDAVTERAETVLVDEQEDGSTLMRLLPRVKADDPRVPAGGWLHAVSGMAVHVEGISHENRVIVRHLVGEPGEHRADLPVEEFLATHVRADAVPFLGGEAGRQER